MKPLQVLLLSLIFAGCATPSSLVREVPGNLKFLDMYTLPRGTVFSGTRVGGLSGIDYDRGKDLYYLICDDRSETNLSRYYTASITVDSGRIRKVELANVSTLRNEKGQAYASFLERPDLAADPESIRYDARRKLWIWTGEGERLQRHDTFFIQHPSVNIMGRDGRRRDSFAIPGNMQVRASLQRPRRNGVWEGSAFDGEYRYLYVSTEEPLYEDGPRAGLKDSAAWVRIIKFDASSRKPVAQFAYRIDPVVHPPDKPGAFIVNGVSEILWLNKDRLLVMERSYSSGQAGSAVRLYIASLAGATDVTNVSSLSKGEQFVPLSKQLLLDLGTLGFTTDNLEGMTLGPQLANGKQSLLIVSDDNFSERNHTQFLLFEID